jgi:hypothetical protein
MQVEDLVFQPDALSEVLEKLLMSLRDDPAEDFVFQPKSLNLVLYFATSSWKASAESQSDSQQHVS